MGHPDLCMAHLSRKIRGEDGAPKSGGLEFEDDGHDEGAAVGVFLQETL